MMLKKYSIKSIFSQCKLLKNNSGFLLIEIMSALTLLSGMIAIVSSFCWQIIAWQHESRIHSNAIHMVSNILENIKIKKKIPYESKEIKPFSINIERHPVYHSYFSPYFSAHSIDSFYEITVRVAWRDFHGIEKKYNSTTCVALEDNNEAL